MNVSVVARRLVIVIAFFALLAVGFAACKQEVGERCQIDTDCEDGLICNQATALCASSNSSSAIDATTPDFLDAELDPDAPPDAPDDEDADMTAR